MVKYLVTSANGYIALHVVDQLLSQGVHVRGVVRSIKDQKCIEPLIKLATKNKLGKLELIEADLMDSLTWRAAVESIDYIIHFTSPFPHDKLTPQNEGLFEPTVMGTMNILNAAVNCESVKRIVINSCCSTIAGVNEEPKNYLDETGWADVK